MPYFRWGGAVCGCIDRLIELWFYVPLDTKMVISETFPQVSLFSWYTKKTKPNTTKAHIHQSKEMYYNTK